MHHILRLICSFPADLVEFPADLVEGPCAGVDRLAAMVAISDHQRALAAGLSEKNFVSTSTNHKFSKRMRVP
jgi:hypothetical protein